MSRPPPLSSLSLSLSLSLSPHPFVFSYLHAFFVLIKFFVRSFSFIIVGSFCARMVMFVWKIGAGWCAELVATWPTKVTGTLEKRAVAWFANGLHPDSLCFLLLSPFPCRPARNFCKDWQSSQWLWLASVCDALTRPTSPRGSARQWCAARGRA